MEDLIEKKDGELLQKHACDSSDYLIAVACGAVSGLVDIFLVGAPSQSVIGKWTDAQVDEAVKKFAEKSGWSPRPGKEGNVASANVIRIIDRDDRSENEVEELSEKGIKVLDRRHLESYLLDDEIIKKWCATVGKAELENSALTIKQQAINASISRGNATDDIKSASNDIVTNIKKLLGLTACGNNGEAIIRDTITPLITPDTQVYQQLERLIFG